MNLEVLGPVALLFVETLQKEGALESWVEQAKDPIKYISPLDNAVNWSSVDFMGNIYTGGFSWHGSMEGSAYWDAIFHKFNEERNNQ